MAEIITPIQKKVLKFLVEKLQASNISFQVSGGLAAILYGVKRPLYDIDLVIYQRDGAKVENLFKDYIIDNFCHYQDRHFDIYVMTLEIEGVKVDITQEENMFFFNTEGQKISSTGSIKNAHIVQFDHISLPVEDESELIEYKKIIARDTDMQDVEGLKFL